MKSLIVYTLLFLTGFNGFTQQYKETIAINSQRTSTGKSKLYTFSIVSKNIDSCLTKLNEKIGAPTDNGNYTFSWNAINIEGVGQNLSIQLYDGIFTQYEGYSQTVSFKSLEDKTRRLETIGKNAGRDTMLTILSESGENIAQDYTTAQAIQRYLQKVMFNK